VQWGALQELRIACSLAQQEREGGVSAFVSPMAQVRAGLLNSSCWAAQLIVLGCSTRRAGLLKLIVLGCSTRRASLLNSTSCPAQLIVLSGLLNFSGSVKLSRMRHAYGLVLRV
jgi:hypothetical protein